MPKLRPEEYLALLEKLRAGYEEFKKQKESEYRQYPDLDAMDKELALLVEKFPPTTNVLSAEDENDIDAHFEKIQNCYQNITRKNTVMNLHARDMVEGFLEKVDPEEHQYVQNRKTPPSNSVTGGHYEINTRYISRLTSFANYMASSDKAWAPYQRFQNLFQQIQMSGLIQRADGYAVNYNGERNVNCAPFLKRGEQEDSYSDPAEMGLKEFESVLREMEAACQDYLNCEDIKDNPMIEALMRSCQKTIQQALEGSPIFETQQIDPGHEAIQDIMVDFGTMESLEEKKAAQAGMKGSLWVDIYNLDTMTHEKLLQAMNMPDRNPRSEAQRAVRRELIMAYQARDKMVEAQVEAWKNPEDPNYQNFNCLVRQGMKNNLQNEMDIVGNRGLEGTAKSTTILEVLESGWPMQELGICRQLLAYRDILRSAKDEMKRKETEEAEFLQAMDNMADFLDQNVKGAFNSPEATRAFVDRFNTLRKVLREAPTKMPPGDNSYQKLTDVGIMGSNEGIYNFLRRLDGYSKEAVKSMTSIQMGYSFRKEVNTTADLFTDIQRQMEATTANVWFGSREFKNITGAMKLLAEDLRNLTLSGDPRTLPPKDQLDGIRELIDAGKANIDVYLQSKNGKKKFTQAEKDRLDLVIRAKEKLELLEKTLGRGDQIGEKINQEKQEAEHKEKTRLRKIYSKDPDWDAVAEEVKEKITEKIDLVLGQVLEENVADDQLPDGPGKEKRTALRKNIDEICRRGIEAMKKASKVIDGEPDQPGPESVKLSPQDAKDLCVYTCLRGITNNLQTTSTVKNVSYIKQLTDMLAGKKYRQTLEAGVERTQYYQTLTQGEGVSKVKMRNLVINPTDTAPVTKEIIDGMNAVHAEKKAAKQQAAPVKAGDKRVEGQKVEQPQQLQKDSLSQPGQTGPQLMS
jgi:hypothetical protein